MVIFNSKGQEGVPEGYFRCAVCEAVLPKGWTDEEAAEEALDKFGAEMFMDDTYLVCEDCLELLEGR